MHGVFALNTRVGAGTVCVSVRILMRSTPPARAVWHAQCLRGWSPGYTQVSCARLLCVLLCWVRLLKCFLSLSCMLLQPVLECDHAVQQQLLHLIFAIVQCWFALKCLLSLSCMLPQPVLECDHAGRQRVEWHGLCA
jgi:hypothetical protein